MTIHSLVIEMIIPIRLTQMIHQYTQVALRKALGISKRTWGNWTISSILRGISVPPDRRPPEGFRHSPEDFRRSPENFRRLREEHFRPPVGMTSGTLGEEDFRYPGRRTGGHLRRDFKQASQEDFRRPQEEDWAPPRGRLKEATWGGPWGSWGRLQTASPRGMGDNLRKTLGGGPGGGFQAPSLRRTSTAAHRRDFWRSPEEDFRGSPEDFSDFPRHFVAPLEPCTSTAPQIHFVAAPGLLAATSGAFPAAAGAFQAAIPRHFRPASPQELFRRPPQEHFRSHRKILGLQGWNFRDLGWRL